MQVAVSLDAGDGYTTSTLRPISSYYRRGALSVSPLSDERQ